MVELNRDTEWILGRPNFVCGAIAMRLRSIGREIPCKAESEQAYVIHWLLSHYEADRERWLHNAEAEIADKTHSDPNGG